MAGAIKDADMERYLKIRITESGKVGEVLRAEAGLTKRQISQAKFRPGGILKNGKQCRVTEIAVPGDRLQVWKRKGLIQSNWCVQIQVVL